MSKNNTAQGIEFDAVEVLPPDGATERLRHARRLLDECAFGTEIWHGTSLADLPRLRTDLRAAEQACERLRKRLGMAVES